MRRCFLDPTRLFIEKLIDTQKRLEHRQIHVMSEYARRGLVSIPRSLELVHSYFHDTRSDFLNRHLAGQEQVVRRAISQEGYQQIVDDLRLVAQLSKSASVHWINRLDCIHTIRLVAAIRRFSNDVPVQYQPLSRCDTWDVPLGEMVYHEPA